MTEPPAHGDLRLQGNEPFLLRPEGVAWRVERGSLGLFSVEIRDGAPWGSRSFLFEVPAGASLFGVGNATERRGVLAVPLEESVLTSLPERELERLEREEPARLRASVESWRRRWSECLDLAPPPVAPDGGSPLAAQGAFHRWVLQALERKAELDRRAAARRLEAVERSSLDSGRLARRRLAAVLEDAPEPPPAGGGPVFRAAHLVGRALGLSLRPGAQDTPEGVARASRVRARRVALRGPWWRKDAGPLLGFRKPGGQPVALLPAPGGYLLAEPDLDGRRLRLDARLAAELEPEAYVFSRPLPAERLGALDLLRFALRGQQRDVVLALALGALATLLGMTVPLGTGLLVDEAVPLADRALIWQLFAALLAAAVGRALLDFMAALHALRFASRADADTQVAVWDRLLRLRPSFFRRHPAGDLQTRANAVSGIHEILAGATLRSLLGGTLALLNFGLLTLYSLPLALVALGAGAVTATLTAAVSVALLRLEREIESLRGALRAGVVDTVQGVSKLRVAAAEERAFLAWAERYGRQQELLLRRKALEDRVSVAQFGLSMFSVVLLFWFSVNGLGDLRLSAGSFLAFYVAYGAFLGGLGTLSDLAPSLLRVRVLEERAAPILSEPPEVDASKADPGLLEGRVELERISFRYEPGSPEVLRDVSLRAEPGETVAVVGSSGSGKSTLVRLLLGFETPTSGTVRLDGQDLRGLDLGAVRRQIGVVLQDGRLSAGTLRECIAAGADVRAADLEEAVQRAGLAEDVANMPMGLHTVVSEGGSNLSGGQRQRVLIARALVRRPRLLVFDEATRFLDNRSQSVVAESLTRLGVTQIVVAHRLSTVRRADRIYVLDRGTVVQEGSFRELLADADGPFARLMRRQRA